MFCTCVWDLGDDFLAFPSVVYTAAPTHIHTKLQKPARRQDYPAYQKRTHVHYTSWAVALLLLVCFADSVATVVFWRLAHALPSSAFACAGSAVSFGSASRRNTRAHIRSLFCGSGGCSQVLGGLFVLQKPSYHLLFDPYPFCFRPMPRLPSFGSCSPFCLPHPFSKQQSAPQITRTSNTARGECGWD